MPGPGVEKKKKKTSQEGPLPLWQRVPAILSFLLSCFVLFYFLVFMQVAATAPAQALPFRHREEFSALSQL
jgi:flagellar biosynthesis protein FlhB